MTRPTSFVLPTLHEGYGMAVAEALARGLPVVSTETGAIADSWAARPGFVVAPGDERALAQALASVLDDRIRQRLAAGARRCAARCRHGTMPPPGWTPC